MVPAPSFSSVRTLEGLGVLCDGLEAEVGGRSISEVQVGVWRGRDPCSCDLILAFPRDDSPVACVLWLPGKPETLHVNNMNLVIKDKYTQWGPHTFGHEHKLRQQKCSKSYETGHNCHKTNPVNILTITISRIMALSHNILEMFVWKPNFLIHLSHQRKSNQLQNNVNPLSL